MPDQPTTPPEPTAPADSAAAPAPTAPPPLRLDTTAAPVRPAAPEPTVPIESPALPSIDPALSGSVEQATADLARRQSVAPAAITVLEARSLTWPDPSLGCPQPGMAYRQVPVDGILIRLSIGGTIFSYHGGGGKALFLCEQPVEKPAPEPGLYQ